MQRKQANAEAVLSALADWDVLPKSVRNEVPPHLRHIPQRWEAFAPLTSIRSGTQMIPFNPYPYQVSISDLIDANRGVVITKTRQTGMTEFVANKFLHKACLYPTYFAAVFSKGQDDTANIARRVRLMAASARIPLSSNNVKDIQVAGGGRIVFRTASPNSGRGLESVWDILYDESGFVSGIEDIYGAATPAQSIPESQGNARTILVSTPPEVKEGMYYDFFTGNNGDIDALDLCRKVKDQELPPFHAWVDEQGWGKAIIHWRAHPIYGARPNYLQEIKDAQRITETQLQREFNLSFDSATTGVLFEMTVAKAMAYGLWQAPKKGRRYLMGIDPNFGGKDNFVAQVWDCTESPVALVSEYAEADRTIETSVESVARLIEDYGPEIVAVESNSGGRIVLEQLIRLSPSVRIEGVTTTSASKKVNTDRIALAIESREVTYPADWQGLNEMMHFGLMERAALSGKDDRVMAMAAAWVFFHELDPKGRARKRGQWLKRI
jgi:hypothetical protein